MEEKYSILYRPQIFDDVCGNTETINLLKEKSRIGKIGRMLIVHGSSGIGKSTLIYILAKSFLCTDLSPDGNPCCKCRSCLDIQDSLYMTGKMNRGSGVEIFDMGKDGDEYGYINKIVQRVNPPFTSGRRVLILEEMHNTSLKNQQKLNTSLEYVPEDVLILIPTSDYYTKISTHLKTRSDSYLLTNPDRDQIINYLYDISKQIVAKSPIGKQPRKMDIEKLVTLKNSNMRACVDALSILIDCGDIGKDYLMGDYNKKLKQYVDYLTAIKMGIIQLTQFVADVPDKSLFLQSLPKLLEQGISLRSVANELVEPETRKKINSLMQDISEIKVAKLIRSMPRLYGIQEEEARMYLWCIGIELNLAMIKQINLSDEENSIDTANDRDDGSMDIMSILTGGSGRDNLSQVLPFGEPDTSSNIEDLPGNTMLGELNVDDL